jgi:hypothetical protein
MGRRKVHDVVGRLATRKAQIAGVLVAVGVVAVCAAICAAVVHAACFHPPPPVTRPEPGTPRGEYCRAVLPWKPWVSFTLGPVALMAVGGSLGRRRAWVLAMMTLLICGVLIANASVADSLEFAYTI